MRDSLRHYICGPTGRQLIQRLRLRLATEFKLARRLALGRTNCCRMVFGWAWPNTHLLDVDANRNALAKIGLTVANRLLACAFETLMARAMLSTWCE